MSLARQSQTTPTALFVFDVARAVAAMLVLLAHSRDLILLDAGDQNALSPLGRAFYALTGLGHQAVIVFFVISGFLVTGSMLRSGATNRWSFSAFAQARLARLWVVLLPCLLIGAAFDQIRVFVHAAADVSTFPDPAITTPALDPLTFVGNVLFLQTIAVRPYGSNGALWSLANEAWYYALAGLTHTAWRLRYAPHKAIGPIAAAALVLALLPSAILTLAPVWACGAGLAMLQPKLTTRSPSALIASGTAFVAAVALSRLRVGPPFMLDTLLGLATAWLLGCRLHWGGATGPWSDAVRAGSRISYSLYLSHLPLLALATTIVFGGRRQPFSLSGSCWVTAATGLALLFASLVWWCFERHTAVVRTTVSALLLSARGCGLGPPATAEREAAS